MKQTAKYTVSVHDEDAFLNMRASAMLRRMQECANLQLKKMTSPDGIPLEEDMTQKNRGFILCKLNMNIYFPCHAYDELKVESWISNERGVVSERLYKVFKDTELIAEASSLWAMVENGSKIIRVKEYEDLSARDDDTCGAETPKHLRIPEPERLKLVGRRTVYYSDIDMNGHMNNTNYPDMLASFIPAMHYERFSGKKGAFISNININFISEAPLGDTLEVYSCEDGGYIYFKTVRGDGKTNVEARITLSHQ